MEARYRAQNERLWRWFVTAGLPAVWEFVNGGQQISCPDLLLHPEVFKRQLRLDPPGDFERGGATVLECQLRRRIEDVGRAKKRRELAKRRLAINRSNRLALLVMACPEWADRPRIREIYAHARGLCLRDGPRSWHVDHIVPLNNERVCGLHVHFNLRVIPQRENCQKLNAFDERLAQTAGKEYAPPP